MSALLELYGVSKAFGGLRVTHDVNVALRGGDRVALIGPNGAGKTTLVNLITGQLKPDAGRIVLAGRDVTRASVEARVRLGLVRTFQITRLFSSLTALENVALAVLQHRGRTRNWLRPVAKMTSEVEEAQRLLEIVGIGELGTRSVVALAYGHQRQLELAVALALEPKVLLLDEPAAGVPHDEAPRILEAIARLPQDIAVLMIEHDMDLVFRFAQRVLVLANGEVIFQGTPAEVAGDAYVRRAYLGSYADARRQS
ncbi:MAG: ABC transporter ATP-binding protein [Hyphomicrobiales bacterium]|nr:MAG: ABC transporter ATP-binding protein [Hyphomicrobiales bacterium]